MSKVGIIINWSYEDNSFMVKVLELSGCMAWPSTVICTTFKVIAYPPQTTSHQ